MENNQTPTPNPSQQPPAPIAMTFADKMKCDLSSLWENHKLFVIAFGLLIVAAKVAAFLSANIASESRKDLEKAGNEDMKLKTKEDVANAQADALVQHSQALANQETKVDENWNVKK